MLYTLQNETTQITASSRGGELNSLTARQSGAEYLWHGDPAYWKYHAPTLFPIIGRLIGNEYRVDGKTYSLPAHGLPRISEFTCTTQTTDSITFELNFSEATLKVYPYRFSLQITHTLQAHGVTTTFNVINQDAQTIYFSLGAHPALRCPLDASDQLTDCYLEFSQNETASILLLAPSGFLSHEKQAFLQSEHKIPLTPGLLADRTLIFHNLQSKSIALKSKNSTKAASIDISDFPFLGIWSPNGNAPFLCIEPWYGHCDYAGFDGEFKDKADNVALAAGKSFACSYTITIAD